MRLPVSLRLFTVPVSTLSIVAFARAMAWYVWNDGAGWELGTTYLKKSVYISVCFRFISVAFGKSSVLSLSNNSEENLGLCCTHAQLFCSPRSH